MLIRVDFRTHPARPVFGLVCSASGYVEHAAPFAAKARNKHRDRVVAYYKRQGAAVQMLVSGKWVNA